MTQITFEGILIEECGEALVDARTYPFVVTPAYYQQGISTDPTVRLRKSVLDKLLKAQETFNGKYQFKLWDGYRSRSTQSALYDALYAAVARKYPDATEQELTYETQRYVTKATDPTRIPPHATGGAIDLTLVDQDNNELDMGTVFDHFGPQAKTDYFDGSKAHEVYAKNRQLLFDALTAQGFTNDTEEWWHYDYGNQVWVYHTGNKKAWYGEV